MPREILRQKGQLSWQSSQQCVQWEKKRKFDEKGQLSLPKEKRVQDQEKGRRFYKRKKGEKQLPSVREEGASARFFGGLKNVTVKRRGRGKKRGFKRNHTSGRGKGSVGEKNMPLTTNRHRVSPDRERSLEKALHGGWRRGNSAGSGANNSIRMAIHERRTHYGWRSLNQSARKGRDYPSKDQKGRPREEHKRKFSRDSTWTES